MPQWFFQIKGQCTKTKGQKEVAQILKTAPEQTSHTSSTMRLTNLQQNRRKTSHIEARQSTQTAENLRLLGFHTPTRTERNEIKLWFWTLIYESDFSVVILTSYPS